MQPIPKRSFLECWRIGFKQPECGLVLVVAFWTFFFTPTVSNSPEAGWLTNWGFFALWVLGIVLFIPYALSHFPISNHTQNRVVAELEPTIQQLLDLSRINWPESNWGQIDVLVKQGDKSACKLVRNALGVTWDQADVAIKNWPMTVLKAKLGAIEKAIAERNSELVSA